MKADSPCEGVGRRSVSQGTPDSADPTGCTSRVQQQHFGHGSKRRWRCGLPSRAECTPSANLSEGGSICLDVRRLKRSTARGAVAEAGPSEEAKSIRPATAVPREALKASPFPIPWKPALALFSANAQSYAKVSRGGRLRWGETNTRTRHSGVGRNPGAVPPRGRTRESPSTSSG